MNKIGERILNNQITHMNRVIFNKRNEFAYLYFGVQQLEGHIYGLKDSDSEPTAEPKHTKRRSIVL
jgi:hypothetical protein